MAVLGAVIVVAGSSAFASSSSSASSPLVSVFPIPGSQVAPPGTQIVFRGISPFALSSVMVSGSQSGNHPGRIEGDSDGNGGSFLPAAPFRPGEIVTVSTSMNLVGAPSGAYQFRVATSSGPVPPAPIQRVPRVRGDVLSFHSRPDLRPPAVKIIHSSAAALGRYLFLAPQFGPLRNGPMILDRYGNLVYFNPLPKDDLAADFRLQQYEGQTDLTWWQGYTNAGVGVGEDEIYDSSYRRVAEVNAAGGLSADLHEFLLTPAGTALILAYYPVMWDTSSVGGSKHKVVLDSVVQEIDIRTGLELFQWDSLDHVSVRDSYMAPARGFVYDYFHVNSVDVDTDGNLIISARNTWAAYKINRSSGAIMWTLGGKRSSFKLMPGASFAFQHDVEVHGAGGQLLTLFDDGAGPPTIHHQSRGLTLRLDFERMTASVVDERDHSPPLSARFQGNVQPLGDGHELVGWGQQPYFTEFGRRGEQLLDARFVGTTSSYRVYGFPSWTGSPAGQPDVSTSNTGPSTTVYASWNGSTEIAFWLVLSGRAPRHLSFRRLVRRAGFETAARVARARYVRVEALDARGHVLGSTPAISMH